VSTDERDAAPGQPLVSVVMPAYNAEAYLRDAVESALNQTYENLEVVIVNDGSTDSTPAMARSFGPRVRVIDQKNGGIANARNTAIRHARGSVIALLDADDIWMPSRIERCVELLQADPTIGFVTTDAYLLINDEPTDRRYYGAYQRYPFPPADAQLSEIASRNFMFVSVVFDRRLLDVTDRMFDQTMRAAEDFELWTRFLLAGTRAGLVQEPLAWYRVRSDSVSRMKDKQWRAHRSVLERHLPSLWLMGAHGRPQDAYEIGLEWARRGERRVALRYLTRAVREPGSGISSRLRYLLGGLWSVVAGPRSTLTRART
jgi:glycosyltransferase involved in cell wall biosynthesis